MKRDWMLDQLQGEAEWDIIIIGGGATGLGIAVDAVTRGYRTLLLEKYDFAKCTSSRSTKLIHGGVRYLAQGDIKLVREALHERALLLKNASHLSRLQEFLIPAYKWWEKTFYGIGLTLYDALAGQRKIGHTRWKSRQQSIEKIPVINSNQLHGGITYFDGQFDDARLAVNLAATAAAKGASVINYCAVTGLISVDGKIKGVVATDQLTGKEYRVKGKVVVNATGIFVDEILGMEKERKKHMVAPSRGVHLVLDRKFFPGQTALMIPKTADKRVLFAVPWYHKVVVGTTDTPVEEKTAEPRAQMEEVDFILHHFNKYTTAEVSREEVSSVFAGLRPLVKSSDEHNTALLSRDHTILVSPGGLLTITGGKWTTYRKMAEDAVAHATQIGNLPSRPCVTETLRLHAWKENPDQNDPIHQYGTDAEGIRSLMKADHSLSHPIHPKYEISKAEIVWVIREEMAMTIEDVLARRTRLLFLDARAAREAAGPTAEIMQRELGWDETRKNQEVDSFTKLASEYIL